MRALERLYRAGDDTTEKRQAVEPGTLADVPLFRVPWTALPGVVQVLQVRASRAHVASCWHRPLRSRRAARVCAGERPRMGPHV